MASPVRHQRGVVTYRASGEDHVSVAFDVESTEVAAAFQPSLPQEVVQFLEGSVGLYLYIHPEDGREGVLDAQTKEPYDFPREGSCSARELLRWRVIAALVMRLPQRAQMP